MATSDDKLREWMESLAAEGIDRDALGDVEADLIGRIGRLRKRRDHGATVVEAARLLPYGADALAERQHCHRSTVYRRAERGRKIVAPPATQRDKAGGR